METLRFSNGDMVELSSDHDGIAVEVEADATLRRGVVAMSHGWGGLPDRDGEEGRGVSVNLLISADRDLEEMNSMPRMTAIPVSITRYDNENRPKLQNQDL